MILDANFRKVVRFRSMEGTSLNKGINLVISTHYIPLPYVLSLWLSSPEASWVYPCWSVVDVSAMLKWLSFCQQRRTEHLFPCQNLVKQQILSSRLYVSFATYGQRVYHSLLKSGRCHLTIIERPIKTKPIYARWLEPWHHILLKCIRIGAEAGIFEIEDALWE